MKTLIFGILFLSLCGLAYGQGTVVDTSFFSNALDTTRFVDIYLPEGYEPNGNTDYPVIYFLHGSSGNQDSYGFIVDILDSLIGNQIIDPIIVVKPDASISVPAIDYEEGSWYTNSALYGQFEDYIVFDLIDFVDTRYKTIATPDKRTIMGHSMGGFGSMQLALKHPDIYRGVASHSGLLNLSIFLDFKALLLAEYGGSPPYNYTPDAGPLSLTMFILSGAFSPNLSNPPYLVDLPLDTSGNVIDSISAKWRLQDPVAFAAELPPNTDLAIYFDCGTLDINFFVFNSTFADSLDKIELNYEFQSYLGGHEDKLLSRFPISLAFLDSVMKSTPVGIFDQQSNLPESIVLFQNYPNPFNPSTTIEFSLPLSGFVTLKVYNTLGQEISNLASEKLHVGNYEYTWNANGFASGVYYYRLQVESFVQTKKLILLR